MNWRSDFPFFDDNSMGYLDNAATTQKPRVVIEGIASDYQKYSANVYRGIYRHAEATTERFEQARARIASFIGAHNDELVITSGATAGINLIASSWGSQTIKQGDEIIVSIMEHHSNLLPWQQLAARVGARLKVIPLAEDGHLDMGAYEQMLSKQTRLVAITYVSNVLGTVVDVPRIVAGAHAVGARVLLDVAQAVAHRPVNVRALGVDFAAFSGHKLFGPTGVGGLYITRSLHNDIQPVWVGGGMVAQFDWHAPVWAAAPRKFEAGTPPIIQALGLSRAMDYVASLGFEAIHAHEQALMQRLRVGMQQVPRVRLLGPAQEPVLSLVVEGMHAHDVAAFLDNRRWPIAVRAGHHCAAPLLAALGLAACVRVSLALYSNVDEIDAIVAYMQQLPA